MFSPNRGMTCALRVGAYITGIALLAALTAWGAYRVGTTTIGFLDTKILDGSGKAQPAPVWAAPPFATDPRDEQTASSTADSLHATTVAAPPPPRASTDDPVDDPAAAFHSGSEATFKTYCVRLCDGYYWPISFSTTSDRFEEDASACRSSCGSPARLFVHPIPGGGPATMVSLDGLPYSALKSAFLFRTKYDAQCRCQPQPWEEAARDRHRLFAASEAAQRGDLAAADEAARLKRKVADERRSQLAAKNEADKVAARELERLADTSSLTPPSHAAANRQVDPDRDNVVRLGALQQDPPKRSFVPASGTGRSWKDTVFGEN